MVQGLLVSCSRTDEKHENSPEKSGSLQLLFQTVCVSLVKSLEQIYVPTVRLASGEESSESRFTERQIYTLLPVYEYAAEHYRQEQREVAVRRILWEEASEELSGEHSPVQEDDQIREESILRGDSPEEEEEQKPAGEEPIQETILPVTPEKSFLPHERQLQIDPGTITEYDTLLKQFYTVDSTTKAEESLINAQKFLEKDMTIERNVAGPQILIYHTHSQEAFADSNPEDSSTTIVGAGERLKKVLEETYGFQVLHHTQCYDLPDRNKAYSNAKGSIEQLLADNPSIQVVIDLHRDSMPEEKHQVIEIDGRPTAKFMFFNGLSYNRKTGPITYLKNENLESNLAFSFQMQKAANEYYPGVTRKIYLKSYRYNMHLMDKYLLIELGAQNNTVEEIMNACDVLGHLLYLVLTGEA